MASLLGNAESIRYSHMGQFARNSRNQESDGVFYAHGNDRALLGGAFVYCVIGIIYSKTAAFD